MSTLSGPNYPRDITPDGRFVLFRSSNDLWMLALDEDRRLHRLLGGIDGRVSPNGRWLAYTAVETGQPQVWVTTFPKPGDDGGCRPPADRIRSGGETGRSSTMSLKTTRSSPFLSARAARFRPASPDLLFRPAFDPQSVTFGVGVCGGARWPTIPDHRAYAQGRPGARRHHELVRLAILILHVPCPVIARVQHSHLRFGTTPTCSMPTGRLRHLTPKAFDLLSLSD